MIGVRANMSETGFLLLFPSFTKNYYLEWKVEDKTI